MAAIPGDGLPHDYAYERWDASKVARPETRIELDHGPDAPTRQEAEDDERSDR